MTNRERIAKELAKRGVSYVRSPKPHKRRGKVAKIRRQESAKARESVFDPK